MEEKKKYLLKGDISGIQEFIFNVPGKGASRNLKGRSFFIQVLTEIAEKYFEDITGGKEVLYNGGGNLFVYLNSTKEVLDKGIQHFQNCFQQQTIFPFMAYVEANDDELFAEQMKQLNREITRQKLRRPVSFKVVDPLNAAEFDDKFKDFTQNMVAAEGYKIEKNNEAVFKINEDSFDIAGYSLRLQREANPEYPFAGTIINAMPQNGGGILEFDKIAEKAQARNVDDKLAALKIDVDNLGILFRNRTKEQYKVLSQGVQDFFAKTLYTNVLKEHIDSGDVYPVFAGGDDCFLIGTWDKILKLANEIQQKFNTFQIELCKKVGIKDAITISAGVVICNPKYPLTRMAETAENALELAKEYGKNRVCLFGEVLKWVEFNNAESLAHTLKKLILEEGESRALLERIRSSEIGFRSLQERAVSHGKIDFPKVYRLKYYLRNAKKPDSRKILEQEFDKYAEALLNDFVNQEKESNAAQFPVAARWAELLTKSGNS
jgi:CRISPR/Cas system-associated protein Cas10 (large subunit of type III CRISPR-Cas system)